MTESTEPRTEPLTAEEEAFHEWLCRTARFSRAGTWGTVARNTLVALRSTRSEDEPGTLDVERLARAIASIEVNADPVAAAIAVARKYAAEYDRLGRLSDPHGIGGQRWVG